MNELKQEHRRRWPDTQVEATNEPPTQESTVVNQQTNSATESGQEIKTETNEPNELEISLTDRLIHGRIQEMNQFQQKMEQRFEHLERTVNP